MSRKTVGILLVIVIVIAAAVYGFRGQIALRVIGAGAERAMTSNPLAALGPGLHVLLCGAGGPLPDTARSGPCVAVMAGERIFIVDAGTNSARNLTRFGFPVPSVQAVFLTHFHSDHIDGLGELAMMRWVNSSNASSLPVHGASGVEKVVAGFNESYAQDALYRNLHHGDEVALLETTGMIAVAHAQPALGEALRLLDEDDVIVEMIRVDHSPVTPAVGYRFSYAGRTVLISGDTVKSANLQTFAEGVDLLVHEALAPNLVGEMQAAAVRAGNSGFARILVDIPDYHTTPVEAAEIARDANVGHLLYYHIVPPLVVPGSEAAWLAGVDTVFSDYTVGTDGTIISLSPVAETN